MTRSSRMGVSVGVGAILLATQLAAAVHLSGLSPGRIERGKTMVIKITSPAFEDGGMIPRRHTCDGPDVSPALAWAGVPAGATTLALICDDPDAPGRTWVHWVVFNLPASVTGLPDAVPPHEKPAIGGVQGRNDFGRIGYGGPCPPGGTHRYFFKLYALDAELKLAPGATKQQVLDAAKGHVLAEGQLMGKYSRR